MSVFKRKTAKGETREYHYKFMQDGKSYHGVCEGCTTERAALTFEKTIKDTAKKLSEQQSVGALVENFKRELTGGGKIKLDEAFVLYMAKPRRKMPSNLQQGINRSQWDDFCAFMNATYPDIEHIDKVTRQHAEAYIKQLRDSGRFAQAVKYTRVYNAKSVDHSYKTQTSLSGRTINAYHKTLKSVFSKLQEDAGILYNPFDFEMIDNDSESRDAFTPAELKLIGDNLNDFVKPIFIIGICTGLSEGDICLLRWSEIRDGWIVRKRRKTGSSLEIPILPPLIKFFGEQRLLSGDQDYVLPEHAAMYKVNPSGISYRVKSFLESLGLTTTRTTEGRGRAVSVKDVHSLRHTFAYMAGCYQIPLPVVQSILGHMSPEMTKHYQAHADRQAKEKYLAQMPYFLNAGPIQQQLSASQDGDTELHKLIDLVKQLSPDMVKKTLDFVQNKISSEQQ